jgi:hypothetical protein
MGYGVKTDFQQNKSFDLDKSYKYIIKPAVEAAGYKCERADEIQHAGIIDVPMYDRLLDADLVIADLSTANVNAFFELGVRYALRPQTTIVLAEKGFKIPFDIGHVLIRHYEHLGAGIDYGEVERMKNELTVACRVISQGGEIDSPVYIFIRNLVAPKRHIVAAAAAEPVIEEERERRTRDALSEAKSAVERVALSEPFAALMAAAMDARFKQDFVRMRDVLSGVRAAQGDRPDPFVIQQLALATYKAAKPDLRTALFAARDVLGSLNPEGSSDPETLGLWGAIHKRIWGLSDLPREESLAALDAAIWAHEKGFYLKNDYYNGINLAFLLSARAAGGSGDEAVADRVQAQRVRERVLKICEHLLAAGIRAETDKAKQDEEYWIRATMAEALFGLGRMEAANDALAAAKAIASESWMAATTEDQLSKLKKLLPSG